MAYPGSQTKITVIHDRETTSDLQHDFINSQVSKIAQSQAVRNLLEDMATGVRNGSVQTTIDDGNAVAATDTLTLTNFSTANDTILINGVTLTAVASGATNNQWNVKASAILQATEIARAINASSTSLVSGHVLASSTGASGVVTLTAVIAGLAGNSVTTAKGVDAGTVMTFSAARLAGGLAPTNSGTVTYATGV